MASFKQANARLYDNVFVCKRCKSKVKKGIRICPHCGVLNPTLTPMSVLFWTVVTLLIIGLISYLNNWHGS